MFWITKCGIGGLGKASYRPRGARVLSRSGVPKRTGFLKQSPSWEANRFSASRRNSPHFVEPTCSLPHLQSPATCPYPESGLVHAFPSHFIVIHFNIILHLNPFLPSGLLISGLPAKTLYTPLLSPIRATCPADLIVLDAITRRYLVRSTNHKAHYAVYPSPLLSRVCHAQVSSSAPYSRTPSAHVPPSVCETKTHQCKTTGKVTVLFVLIFIAY